MEDIHAHYHLGLLVFIFVGLAFVVTSSAGFAWEPVPLRYHEGFEEGKDPVVFWTTNGSYTINFKGITEERTHSGKKAFKLDVTFNSGTYFYWGIPIRVPVEGVLNFGGWIFVGEETTGEVGLGIDVAFPPVQLGGCNPFERHGSTDGKWVAINGDVTTYGKALAGAVVKANIWKCTGENVGIYADMIGLFLYGKAGQRVVVYVDDLLLEGNVPKEEDYQEVIRGRWAGYTGAVSQELTSWEGILDSQEVTPGDQQSKVTLLRGKLKVMKETLKNGGYIARSEGEGIERAIAQLRSDAGAAEAQPPWLKEKVGLSDHVPPPWTPVTVDDRSASVWGRTYSFCDQGPLPGQVTALGEPLLAAPVRIDASSGGRKVQLVEEKWTWVHRGEPEARFLSEGKLGPAVWKAEAGIEFDGMMRIDLWVRVPEEAAPLDELTLEIPIREEFATLLHSANNTWDDIIAQAIPSETGWTWESKRFRPSVWIGNETRGFTWFAESTDGWILSTAPALTLKRQEDRVVLRVKLFAAPLQAGQERQITFGLQATPVKPMPKDFRAKRLAFDDFYGGNERRLEKVGLTDSAVIWWNYNEWFGVSDLKDPDGFRQQVQSLHSKGLKALGYFALAGLAEESPLRDYAILWKMDPGWILPNVENRGQTAIGVCPGTSWADYLAYSIRWQMETFGTDGVYLDVAYPFMCNVHNHTRSGIPAYTIFATRELMKRIYNIVKEINPDGEVVLHTSGSIYPPIASFSTMYLDGEQFVILSEKEHLTPDAFRAEFMGIPYGVQAQLLPEVESWSQDKKREISSRNLLAISLLHDVVPVPAWIDKLEIARIWRLYDEFQVWGDGVVFYPYWDGSSPFGSDTPAIKVSGYTRPGGGSLIIVSNVSPQPVTGKVRVVDGQMSPNTATEVIVTEHAAPGSSPADISDGKVLDIVQGEVEVSLPPLEFLILEVE